MFYLILKYLNVHYMKKIIFAFALSLLSSFLIAQQPVFIQLDKHTFSYGKQKAVFMNLKNIFQMMKKRSLNLQNLILQGKHKRDGIMQTLPWVASPL